MTFLANAANRMRHRHVTMALLVLSGVATLFGGAILWQAYSRLRAQSEADKRIAWELTYNNGCMVRQSTYIPACVYGGFHIPGFGLEFVESVYVYNDAVPSGLLSLSAPKHVSLIDPSISDTELRQLVPLRSLRVLNVARTSVSDLGMSSLCKLENLRVFVADETLITDEGVACIAKLEYLEHLSLKNTRISDVGVKCIAMMPRLSSLVLDSTDITDECARELGGMKRLERLYVNKTCVTDDFVKTASQAMRLREISAYSTGITLTSFVSRNGDLIRVKTYE